MKFWKLYAACLSFFFFYPSFAYVQFGTENTIHGQGLIDINVKNRTYLMLGGSGFHIGPVAYYQQPYSGFREVIYGLGIRIGKKFTVGLDAGYIEKQVFGVDSSGLAGALVMTYALSPNWYLSVPFIYRQIDEGEMAQRVEASFLPYLGVKFDL